MMRAGFKPAFVNSVYVYVLFKCNSPQRRQLQETHQRMR